MATQFVEGRPSERGEVDVRPLEVGATSSIAETIAAGAALVLAILGLAGALPTYMMSIATIALGVAILFEAGTVGARYQKLVHAADPRLAGVEVGGGMSAEMLAGLAGITLGILALLGLAPVTLCSVALIAFGGGELLGSAATARFRSISWGQLGVADSTRRLIDETVNASAGAEVIVGIGAIVLGILALSGIVPRTLVLVGLLGVSAGVLLGGSAVGARMLGILKHAH